MRAVIRSVEESRTCWIVVAAVERLRASVPELGRGEALKRRDSAVFYWVFFWQVILGSAEYCLE